MQPTFASPLTQIVTGSAIASTPWWVNVLEMTNQIAGTIAVVCGAIIGVIGVFRAIRRFWEREKERHGDF